MDTSETKAHHRFKISLRLAGARIDTETVKAVLQLTPTRVYPPRKLRSGTLTPHVWSYSLESQTLTPEELIVSLLDLVAPSWSELQTTMPSDTEFDLFFGVFPGGDQCGFEFSSALLQRLVSMRLSIQFDIYGIRSDADESEPDAFV